MGRESLPTLGAPFCSSCQPLRVSQNFKSGKAEELDVGINVRYGDYFAWKKIYLIYLKTNQISSIFPYLSELC